MDRRNFGAIARVMFCRASCVGAAAATTAESGQQQQSGDPVQDAARRSREQQKECVTEAEKSWYTDDDVKPATPRNDGGAATSQRPGRRAERKLRRTTVRARRRTAQGRARQGRRTRETAWRKRFQDQRNKIATAEKELDILQREAEKARQQMYNDPQKALMEQNTRKDINDKNAKIVIQEKRDIAGLKQQLDDMEDELRKSGGDPGWAR